MYRIPKDLDLSPIIGEFATQIRVGQFDLQFTFGDINFIVQSPINLFRDGRLTAHWEPGRWPDGGFYEIMNTEIRHSEVVSDSLIVIEFENHIQMHLVDNSDQHESMQIQIRGNPFPWII